MPESPKTSAFTRQTGEAHWHVLQRARAIENGAYVISAAQGGRHEDGRAQDLAIHGVGTIVRMAVDYGMSIGFESTDLITALLLVQFVGFPAAIFFGWLGKRWGVKRSIFLAIAVYMAVTVWGMQMQEKFEFYLLAAVIGLVQGGIQALSRSYFTRLIPRNQAAEYFGFYNMLGKFAVIIGPALMGAVGLLVRRMLMPDAPNEAELAVIGQEAARWSIGSILILFALGAVLLYFVDEEKGREEAQYLSGS